MPDCAGIMCSTGRWQAVNPAKPNDAAINLRTVRRELPSSISDAFAGNSRFTNSRNSGASATSFRLRQYFLPVGLPACGFAVRMLISFGELVDIIDGTPNNWLAVQYASAR